MPTKTRLPLPALTGIRFLAAFHVLVLHVCRWDAWDAPTFVRAIAGTGFVAVTLFFVLSGFVLTYSNVNADGSLRTSARTFYERRFLRIYPAYALALGVSLPFYLHHALKTVAPWALPLRSGAVIALMQAHIPWIATEWNGPAWSLSVEAFFYALFPVVVPALMICSRKAAWVTTVLAYAASLAVPIAYLALSPDPQWTPSIAAQTMSEPWLDFVRFNPAVRMPEFLLGVISARAFAARTRGGLFDRTAGAISLLSAACIVAVLGCGLSIPYPLLHNSLLAPVFALLIASLAAGRGPVASFLARPRIVRLGEASYALYILQQPILILWAKAFARWAGRWEYVAGFMAASILVSIVSHERIEPRIRRAIQLLIAERRTVAVAPDVP